MPEPFDNLVVDIIAGLVVAVMLAIVGWLWRRRKPPTPSEPHATGRAVAAGRDIRGPVATGDEAAVADRGSTAVREMHGGTVIHIDNLNVYTDGLPQAEPEVRDPFEEGLRLQQDEQHQAAIAAFENAFAAAENDSQRCALHVLIGNSFLHLSRPTEAEGRYSEALQAAQRANDTKGQGAALGGLGNVYSHRGQPGDLDKAEQHHKKALAIHQQMGDKLDQAQDLGNLGNVYFLRGQPGDIDKAEQHHKKALAISRKMRNRLGEAQDLANLGSVYFQRDQPGDLDKAEQHFKKALQISREIGSTLGQATLLGNLGNVYAHRGEADRAEEHYKKALDIQGQIGDRLGQARQLGNLGLLHRDTDRDQALRYLRQARRIFADIGASAQLKKTDEFVAGLEATIPPKPKRKRSRKKPPPKP